MQKRELEVYENTGKGRKGYWKCMKMQERAGKDWKCMEMQERAEKGAGSV